VLAYRLRNDELSKGRYFETDMIKEITKAKVSDFRIHESGDFYSQEYIDKWVVIASVKALVNFYFYTKNAARFDFSKLLALDNVNMVDSMTHKGFNYGNYTYCAELVADGYTLCPCHLPEYDQKTGTKQCMKDCKACGSTSKVCFIQH